MKLEFKHIASYLPYDLRIQWNDSKCINGICFESRPDYNYDLYSLSVLIFIMNETPQDLGFKLILRPLSQLTEEIEHNGEKFVPFQRFYPTYPDFKYSKSIFEDWITRINIDEYKPPKQELLPLHLSRADFEYLYMLHFDIYGLIENGLAVEKKD